MESVFSPVLASAFARAIPFGDKDLASEESLWDSYERWRSHHRVSRHPDEARKQFDEFRENEEFIHAFNNKETPYKLGLNGFADMANEDFRSWSTGSDVHRLRGRRRHRSGEELVGRARLHQDAVWHRHGSFLSHQNISQSFKDEL
ncbi:thiol protease SEN102-like [Musa acuminata AAA Group]|uniref:thiol protease SEN102-like n=1 Tax=Musa acuminata AAA Group TaxID=214697 RepID=UPI0031DF34A6